MMSRLLRRISCGYKNHSYLPRNYIHNEHDAGNQHEYDKKSIVLFPGQGSEFVGMAKSLQGIPEAKQLFDEASELLKYDLLRMCLDGPGEKLCETVHCQPAIFVTSLAALHLLKQDQPNFEENCIGTAGFSLGEITSLVFAGAIPFEQAVNLIRIRAEAMQVACEEIRGGMAAVLLKEDGTSQLTEACERAKKYCIEDYGLEHAECSIANELYPNCKVIAGNLEAMEYVQLNVRTYNLKAMRAIPAFGAFHTPMMQSAVQPVEKALQKMCIKKPQFAVYSNLTATPYENEMDIKSKLPQQIVMPVKWEQTLQALYSRFSQTHTYPETFACGPAITLLKNLEKMYPAAHARASIMGSIVEVKL